MFYIYCIYFYIILTTNIATVRLSTELAVWAREIHSNKVQVVVKKCKQIGHKGSFRRVFFAI